MKKIAACSAYNDFVSYANLGFEACSAYNDFVSYANLGFEACSAYNDFVSYANFFIYLFLKQSYN